MKTTGTVLVSVLVIIAALAVATGLVENFWPAQQLSPTAQQVIEPGKEVSTFPFTSLTDLKNKKVKLEVIKKTVGVVDDEVDEKIGAGETAYGKIIGTAENPGLVGLGLFGLLTAFGTRLYDKSKMYSVEEVKLVQKGETIL